LQIVAPHPPPRPSGLVVRSGMAFKRGTRQRACAYRPRRRSTLGSAITDSLERRSPSGLRAYVARRFVPSAEPWPREANEPTPRNASSPRSVRWARRTSAHGFAPPPRRHRSSRAPLAGGAALDRVAGDRVRARGVARRVVA